MSEEYPQLVGAYVPSTQDIVLHIPRALWESLPREAPDEGPLGELLAAVWATPGLGAVLGEQEAPQDAPQDEPPPVTSTDVPPEQQTAEAPDASPEEGHSDAPA